MGRDTTVVKERPIIFSADSVRAILAGAKSQTRRVVKPPAWWKGMTHYATGTVDDRGLTLTNMVLCDRTAGRWQYCPYGTPKCRLWVRETFSLVKPWHDPDSGHAEDYEEWTGPLPKQKPEGWVVMYRADWPSGYDDPADRLFRWRSPIHMPRWASRITLENTGTRVERLQRISKEDAAAEGVVWETYDPGFGRGGKPGWRWAEGRYAGSARHGFELRWGLINIKRPGCSWADNPWVWVLEFKALTGR